MTHMFNSQACLYLLCLVYSLALHPERSLVATGQIGKTPFICVWDTSTLDTVSILQGAHERGISALGFNSEGNVRREGGREGGRECTEGRVGGKGEGVKQGGRKGGDI